MKTSLWFYIAISLCVVVVIRCENVAVSSDSEKDRHTGITGKLLKPDGVSPASEALVTLCPHSTIVSINGTEDKAIHPKKKRVQTASDGTFKIDHSLSGVFALEGTDREGNAVRIDSVVVSDPDDHTHLPDHILKSTGTLSGKVTLKDGGSSRNVFVLVFGSDRFIQLNSDGTFLMENLPYGNYTLKIVCVQREYGNSLTIPITVKSGDTTDIGDQVLAASEVCGPENAKLLYDSLTMVVTLTWTPCDDKSVVGYNIYKYNNKSADQYPIQPLNTELITNGSYVDYDIVVHNQYTYGISSVSASGGISRKAGPLTVVSSIMAFDLDTIVYNDPLVRPIGVHWDHKGQLRVAVLKRESGTIVDSLFVDFYNSNLGYDTSIFIKDIPRSIMYILMRNNYILFKKIAKDETIHCYSMDGMERYSIRPQTQHFMEFSERNDTLYVNGTAYDTAGNHLFNFDQHGDSTLIKATNNNLYALTKDNTISLFSPETNSFSEVFKPDIDIVRARGKLPWRLDVNKGLFHLYKENKIILYSANGLIKSRFIVAGHFFSMADKVQSDKLCVDPKGRITCITGRGPTEIITLTPKYKTAFCF